MNEKELMEMGKKKPEPAVVIKLTAASLRELRLMYSAGALGRAQLHKLLGLPAMQALPQEQPLPADLATQFLQDLKEGMEKKLEHRT